MDRVYTQHPLSGNKIRILTLLPDQVFDDRVPSRIRCELRSVSLEQKPNYVTLSYAWGTEERNRDILVDGQIFSATLNLYNALQRFCGEESRSLWVDAICINQKNDEEVENQMKMMCNIFSEAQETWVWLGTERDESSHAVDLIEHLSARVGSNSGSYHLERSERVRGEPKSWHVEDVGMRLVALEALFIRDYWYRAWVVQEIALSKTLTVFCGSKSFPWDHLVDAAFYIDGCVNVREIIHACWMNNLTMVDLLHEEENSEEGWDIHAGIQRIFSIQSVRLDFQNQDRDNIEVEPCDSLLFLLSNHRSTKSKHPADKYFALAGLVEDEFPENSRKKSAKEIYIWAACSIAKQQTTLKNGLALDFLDCAGVNTIVRKSEVAADLPTWTPDWSYYKRRATPLLHWQFSGKPANDKIHFNAPSGIPTSTHKNTFSLVPGCDLLLAHGLEFDRIHGIGYYDSPWVSPLSFKECHVDKYPTDEYLADVVWKTCVMNRTSRALEAPTQWGEVFHIYSYRQQWYNKNKSFRICGRTLEDITLENLRKQGFKIGGKTREEIAEENVARQRFLSKYDPELLNLFAMAFDIAVGQRRLATTQSGYLCMVPFDTRLGDIIAILHDCHAPVVLRKESKGIEYKFIGTCYVHGIMTPEDAYGEIANADRLREFKIL